jgi:hypothetical protein
VDGCAVGLEGSGVNVITPAEMVQIPHPNL